MGMFIREKKIHCGKEHMEVDIYQLGDAHKKKSKSRKREQVTAPAQKNLNDKRARRYMRQLVKTNFTTGDLHISCTYRNSHLPDTLEDAEKEVSKFIRRIQYRRKKLGMEPAKYIIITEGHCKKEKPVRIHHHIILSKMDRDLVEDLWRKPRQKGQKAGERIGFCNVDRLQVDDDGGVNALVNYLSKDPQGRKRWRGSQKLIKPTFSTADKKWTKKKLAMVAGVADEDRRFWEKQYPGWRMVTCESIYNEITGWSIYLELRRME